MNTSDQMTLMLARYIRNVNYLVKLYIGTDAPLRGHNLQYYFMEGFSVSEATMDIVRYIRNNK